MSDWIEWKWTEEKPYPETLETRVKLKFNGKNHDQTYFVGQWYVASGKEVNSNWDARYNNKHMRITHYKLA